MESRDLSAQRVSGCQHQRGRACWGSPAADRDDHLVCAQLAGHRSAEHKSAGRAVRVFVPLGRDGQSPRSGSRKTTMRRGSQRLTPARMPGGMKRVASVAMATPNRPRTLA